MNEFSWSRAISIARKEVRHLLRDPFTLILALGLPVALLLFFGYAIDYDIQNVRIGIIDKDLTLTSRSLINIFQGSDYFNPERLPLKKSVSSWIEGGSSRASARQRCTARRERP